MPWAGSVFNRLYNWVADKNAGRKVLASRMDGEFDNYKAGLEACLLRDGQNSMTGDIDLGGHKIINSGGAVDQDDIPPLSQVSAIATLHQNLAHNGEFAVVQRGTTSGSSLPLVPPSNGGSLFDRWIFGAPTGFSGTNVVSQTNASDAFVPSLLVTNTVFSKCLKWVCSAANSQQNYYIEQRLENPRAFEQRQLGLLYFSKTIGHDAGNFVELGVNFGTGGSPSSAMTFTGSWVSNPNDNGEVGKAQFRTNVIDYSGKTFGSNNDAYLFVRIFIAPILAGQTFTRYITGVNLGVSDGSSVPQTYISRSFQEDLDLCQRYFETTFANGVTPDKDVVALQTLGVCHAAGSIRVEYPFKIPKRVSPTVLGFRSSDGTAVAGTAMPAAFIGGAWVAGGSPTVASHVSGRGFTATFTATGATLGGCYLVSWNWVATAEQ